MTFLSEGVRSPSWAARAWVLFSTHPISTPKTNSSGGSGERSMPSFWFPVKITVTTSKLVSKWHNQWARPPLWVPCLKHGTLISGPLIQSPSPSRLSAAPAGLVLADLPGRHRRFPPHLTRGAGNAAPRHHILAPRSRQDRPRGHTPAANRRSGTCRHSKRGKPAVSSWASSLGEPRGLDRLRRDLGWVWSFTQAGAPQGTVWAVAQGIPECPATRVLLDDHKPGKEDLSFSSGLWLQAKPAEARGTAAGSVAPHAAK